MSRLSFRAAMLRQHLPSLPRRSGKPRKQGKAGHRAQRGLMMMLLGLLLSIPILATIATSANASGSNNPNYSFQNASQNVSGFFSSANSPDGGGLTKKWVSLTRHAGNAGDFLGYVPPGGPFGWLDSALSNSSNTLSYQALVAKDAQGHDSQAYAGLLSFAHFGAALNSLGYDHMSGGFTDFMHFFFGGIMAIFFILCAGTSFVFRAVIAVLKMLNPFRLFVPAIGAVSPNMAAGMTHGQGASGILGKVGLWLNHIYGALTNMSWTVLIPLFLAFLVAGMLLAPRMNKGTAIKKFLIRLLYLGVGLPLLGSMYSGMLNDLSHATKGGAIAGSQIVAQNYVPFGKWATQDRLTIPAGCKIGWDINAQAPTPESQADESHCALAINAQVYPNLGLMQNGYQQAKYTSQPTQASASLADQMTTMLGLLKSYMSNDTIDASDVETAYKANLQNWIGNPGQGAGKGRAKTVDDWFKAASSSDPGTENGPQSGQPKDNAVLSVGFAGLTGHPFNALHGKQTYTSSNTDMCSYTVTVSGHPMSCNMSPLSLYGYLQTYWGPSSAIVYSPDKATSGDNRQEHFAVSQAGTGITGMVKWLSSLAILAILSFVGLYFALGVLAGALKRTIEFIPAAFGAATGAISQIAKVIIITFALTFEILLPLFLWQFVSEMVTTLPDTITQKVQQFLPAALTPAAGVLIPLASASAFVVCGWIVIKARSKIRNGLIDAFDRLIKKFMSLDTNPPEPPKPGTPGNMSGHAGRGNGGPSSGSASGSSGPAPGSLAAGYAAGKGGAMGKSKPKERPNASGNNAPVDSSGAESGDSGKSESTGSQQQPAMAPPGGSVVKGTVLDGSTAEAGQQNRSDKEVAAEVGKRGHLTRAGSMMAGGAKIAAGGVTGVVGAGGAAAMGAYRGGRNGGGAKGAIGGAAGGVAARRHLGKNAKASQAQPVKRKRLSEQQQAKRSAQPKKQAPKQNQAQSQPDQPSKQQRDQKVRARAVNEAKGPAPSGPKPKKSNAGSKIQNGGDR